MYNNIEKAYKKCNSNTRFSNHYWIYSVITLFIIYTLSKRNLNFIYLLFIETFIQIIFVLLYCIKDAKKYDKQTNYDIKEYVDNLNKEDILNLVKILKNNNITSKDKLDKCLCHYRTKCPIKIKSSFWSTLLTLVIAIASLIVSSYSEKLNGIDLNKLSVALGSTIGIVLIAGFVIYVIKTIFYSLTQKNDTWYEDLEEKMTYIYVNYDEFFIN